MNHFTVQQNKHNIINQLCVCQSLSHVWLFSIPWTVARQAPLSMKFSRQEYWSGKLFPSSGDLPDPGIEPGSPAMHADTFTIWAPSVQFSRSVVSDSHTRPPCLTTNSRSLPKLMSIESVIPSNHLILCHPLLPSIFPNIRVSFRVFSNESALLIRWPKYWIFSFNISPSSEYPGLISFRMDWLDLLAVQGTLKSLLQHHSSKAKIFQCSAFFTVHLSYPYLTVQLSHHDHWENRSLD